VERGERRLESEGKGKGKASNQLRKERPSCGSKKMGCANSNEIKSQDEMYYTPDDML
jgi:hypothetical protein